MIRTSMVTWMAGALLATGCLAGADSDPLDGPDDGFFSDGKDDTFGIADRTPDACAVLRLAREGGFDLLDDDVKLNRKAVEQIVQAREGRFLVDLADLDRVKHVGKAAFTRLLTYARAHGTWACGSQQVQLLATNDFHGNLKPPAGSSGRVTTGPGVTVDAGGAEYLATHIAALRATNPNTVMVAAGDVIGATPLLSALFHDEPTIESMNAMGLGVAGVGNHEFDEGIDELLRMATGGCHPVDGCFGGDGFDGAAFPYLGANVIDAASGEPVLAPYEIVAFRAARVAFIGMTLEATPLVTTVAGVAGLEFRDEIETVNALVPELKAQGVEAIVVLLHEGGKATGLYNECVGISGPVFDIARGFDPAVDVVVAGHTNAAHICDIDGKLVTSAASFGRLITDIDLTIDEVTGAVSARTARNVIVTRDVAKDTAQTALINRYDLLAAPLANRVIGSASGDLVKTGNLAGESTMGNAIADAQLAATAAADQGGAAIAFMNPGGIRTDILAATISGGERTGEITYGEAFAVQPFSNTLVTMDLTGAELDALLEQQWSLNPDGTEKAMILAVSAGFSYTWDQAAPRGARVTDLRLAGAPVSATGVYRVTCNSFLADGGDGFAAFKLGVARRGGAVDVDAFESYLRASSPLAVPALGRITRLN